MKKKMSILLAGVMTVAGLGLVSVPAHANNSGRTAVVTAAEPSLTITPNGTRITFNLVGGPASTELRYIANLRGVYEVGQFVTDTQGNATLVLDLIAEGSGDQVYMSIANAGSQFIAGASITYAPELDPLTVTQRVDGGRQFVVTGAGPGETVTFTIKPLTGNADLLVREVTADETGRAVLTFASVVKAEVRVSSPNGLGGPVTFEWGDPVEFESGDPNPTVRKVVYEARKTCTLSDYSSKGFVYPGQIVTDLSAGQVLRVTESAYGKTRVAAVVEADQQGRATIPAITLTNVNTSGRWVSNGPIKAWETDRRDPLLFIENGSTRIPLATPRRYVKRLDVVRCVGPVLGERPRVFASANKNGTISVFTLTWNRADKVGPVATGSITVKNPKGKTVGTARITGGNSTKVKVKRPAAGKAAVYRVVVKTAGKTVVKKVRVVGVPKVTAKVKGQRLVAKVRYNNRALPKGSKVTAKVAGQKAKTVTVRKPGVVSVKTKVKGEKRVRFVFRDAKGQRLGRVVKVVKR